MVQALTQSHALKSAPLVLAGVLRLLEAEERAATAEAKQKQAEDDKQNTILECRKDRSVILWGKPCCSRGACYW